MLIFLSSTSVRGKNRQWLLKDQSVIAQVAFGPSWLLKAAVTFSSPPSKLCHKWEQGFCLSGVNPWPPAEERTVNCARKRNGYHKCQILSVCAWCALYSHFFYTNRIVLKGLSPSHLEIENGLYIGFTQPAVCIRSGEGVWILVDCHCWPSPLTLIKNILTKTEDLEQVMPCRGCFCQQGNGMESNGMMCCLFKQYQSAFFSGCLPAWGEA